jgi:hypothetical protein
MIGLRHGKISHYPARVGAATRRLAAAYARRDMTDWKKRPADGRSGYVAGGDAGSAARAFTMREKIPVTP